jgi:hypothetical protein
MLRQRSNGACLGTVCSLIFPEYLKSILVFWPLALSFWPFSSWLLSFLAKTAITTALANY